MYHHSPSHPLSNRPYSGVWETLAHILSDVTGLSLSCPVGYHSTAGTGFSVHSLKHCSTSLQWLGWRLWLALFFPSVLLRLLCSIRLLEQLKALWEHCSQEKKFRYVFFQTKLIQYYLREHGVEIKAKLFGSLIKTPKNTYFKFVLNNLTAAHWLSADSSWSHFFACVLKVKVQTHTHTPNYK